MCLLSCVTCHVSPDTCHLSHVKYFLYNLLSFYIIFLIPKNQLHKVVELDNVGSVTNGTYQVYIFLGDNLVSIGQVVPKVNKSSQE